MTAKGTPGYYAARRESASGPDLFRELLAEHDAILRQAWADGRLPDNVMPADLIERTRVALAMSRPLTPAEAIRAAVDRLADGGHA